MLNVDREMPDPDRRDFALERIGAAVKHAHELWPSSIPPDPHSRDRRPRYLDVLQEISDGHSHATAARELGISLQTVRSHLRKARTVFNAKTTPQAIIEALRRGLIE